MYFVVFTSRSTHIQYHCENNAIAIKVDVLPLFSSHSVKCNPYVKSTHSNYKLNHILCYKYCLNVQQYSNHIK